MPLPPGATLVSGGASTAPTAKPGMGAAALGDPNEDISTGPEGSMPLNRLMSPESQRQATKGGLGFASLIPLAFVPETWPLIGKIGAAAGVGAATGAAQGAVAEHPSGRDILKNMGEQGASYGGGELTGGLLQKAFGFLRSLRGVKQAAEASKAEEAATSAATSAATPPKTTPETTGTLAEMATAPRPATTAPAPTSKPAGDIIGERLGILDKDPQSLITSALKPGTNNTKWAADVKRAFPDLKAAESELGRPIKTFDDAEEAIKTAKAKLWSQYEAKLTQVKGLGPNAPSLTNIDGNQVADAMMKAIDQRTTLQNPELVKKITKVADTYRRSMSVEEAEEFLQSANNELNSYYAKNKVGQQVAARDPETGHVVAEANTLRQALYSKLDELTGPGAADLKQRYGALSNFDDVLSKRKNVSLRQQPQSMAEQISKARAYAKIAVGVARGDPWSVYEGVQQSAAATWLKERQTSEAMMERAFANWGRPAAAPALVVSVPRTPGLGQAVRSTQASQEQ